VRKDQQVIEAYIGEEGMILTSGRFTATTVKSAFLQGFLRDRKGSYLPAGEEWSRQEHNHQEHDRPDLMGKFLRHRTSWGNNFQIARLGIGYVPEDRRIFPT
jgi:hypothetical protein